MKLVIIREKLINPLQYDFINEIGKRIDVTLIVSKKYVKYSKKYEINFNLESCKFIKSTPFFMNGSPLNFSFLKDTNILKKFDIFDVQELYSPLSYQIIKYTKRNKKINICEVHENLSYHPGYIFPIYRNISKFNYLNSNILINYTNMAKNAALNLGNRKLNNFVLYPGVDTKIFRFKKKNYENINFLFVGKLEYIKGIFEVLKSFDSLSKNYENINLIICGSGKFENHVKFLARKNDKIKYMGHVYEREMLSKIYQKSHIFILPSKTKKIFSLKIWEEQIGYVFLEAMSTGNCIISTYCGSIPEIIGNNFLVEQNNTNELKKIMEYLINNKSIIKKKSIYNFKRVKKYFTLKKTVKSFLQFISDYQ